MPEPAAPRPKNAFLRRLRLSPEAVEYMQRRRPSVPLPMPDLGDQKAVDRWRRQVNALWGEDDDLGVPHRREIVGGVRCLVAGPEPDSGVPTVVYAHGGGYVLGSAAVAIPITARLARSLRVVSADYRQPPEHPFPAAFVDVLAVYEAVSQAGRPVALAGDSAGGALALSAALEASARGAAPAAVALFSPVVDHADRRSPASTRVDEAKQVEAKLAASYIGNADPADPRISPLRAPAGQLAKLPPVLIQAAEGEPLAAELLRFRERAAQAGANVTLELWQNLWHTWRYHRLPEADQAIAEAAEFVAKRRGGP